MTTSFDDDDDENDEDGEPEEPGKSNAPNEPNGSNANGIQQGRNENGHVELVYPSWEPDVDDIYSSGDPVEVFRPGNPGVSGGSGSNAPASLAIASLAPLAAVSSSSLADKFSSNAPPTPGDCERTKGGGYVIGDRVYPSRNVELTSRLLGFTAGIEYTEGQAGYGPLLTEDEDSESDGWRPRCSRPRPYMMPRDNEENAWHNPLLEEDKDSEPEGRRSRCSRPSPGVIPRDSEERPSYPKVDHSQFQDRDRERTRNTGSRIARWVGAGPLLHSRPDPQFSSTFDVDTPGGPLRFINGGCYPARLAQQQPEGNEYHTEDDASARQGLQLVGRSDPAPGAQRPSSAHDNCPDDGPSSCPSLQLLGGSDQGRGAQRPSSAWDNWSEEDADVDNGW